MASDAYRVFGLRADGSRLSLWRGDTARAAYKAEKLLRVLGGGYTEVYIEKNGKRWIEERWNSRIDE